MKIVLGCGCQLRQKIWDPTKIANGEPKLVREVVVDCGSVYVGSVRKLPH
jgi:hypothetical protein